MDITIAVRLKPNLSWTNLQVVPPDGSTELVYTVNYTLDYCECDLPLENFAETVITDIKKNVSNTKLKDKYKYKITKSLPPVSSTTIGDNCRLVVKKQHHLT